MRRTDFLKALAVLSFTPALLERLKPGVPLGFAHDFMPGEDPASRTGPTGPTDESWVVEFAGATFYLDSPSMLSVGNSKNVYRPTYSATAPFECRMGVNDLDSGWKRLWVTREGKTYVAGVKRNPEPMGVTFSADMLDGEDLTPHPDWWPRRIR
ncbi:MAG TPA: hypothetical protein VNA25_02060 [Phycisphaerae bacterium]|nr:hypothetical protein [Phycisphaerae bacterium]